MAGPNERSIESPAHRQHAHREWLLPPDVASANGATVDSPDRSHSALDQGRCPVSTWKKKPAIESVSLSTSHPARNARRDSQAVPGETALRQDDRSRLVSAQVLRQTNSARRD